MDAAHADIEAAHRSFSASCSRLVRAETAFRHAESWSHMAHKKSLGRFLSTASAEKRVEKAFAHLAAAVAEFQHRYHELAVCFSSQGLDLKDYDWNDKLLHTVFLFLKDYLTVDSESALWSLLERRAIEGA